MMSSAATPVKKHSGHRESHSGIGRKPFAFPPESLFAFSPESFSSSPRNRFRDHPGIPVRLAPESAVQDTPLVAEQAVNLRWTHNLAFGGADALHIASALASRCEEFLTFDGGKKKGILNSAQELFDIFGLNVIRPQLSKCVPVKNNPEQGGLLEKLQEGTNEDAEPKEAIIIEPPFDDPYRFRRAPEIPEV
jgi:hypothetical protein